MEKDAKEKTVIIDIKSALATLNNRGVKTTFGEIAENHGVTTATLNNWGKKAQPSVKFILDFCNETGLTFEELVKEV